jgi:hypothetical protein
LEDYTRESVCRAMQAAALYPCATLPQQLCLLLGKMFPAHHCRTTFLTINWVAIRDLASEVPFHLELSLCTRTAHRPRDNLSRVLSKSFSSAICALLSKTTRHTTFLLPRERSSDKISLRYHLRSGALRQYGTRKRAAVEIRKRFTNTGQGRISAVRRSAMSISRASWAHVPERGSITRPRQSRTCFTDCQTQARSSERMAKGCSLKVEVSEADI